MAAGPLEIYRVPGSVSFLHSGALLHAILPRSNCWCVDGISKFALRVLPDTYYRIELPAETPEDLVKVEDLKETLKKVLFYERTTCPFSRGFTVELPEEPKLRKSRRRSHGPAKKWTLDRAYSWKPEDGRQPATRGKEEFRGSESSSGSDEEAEVATATEADLERQTSNSSELADEVKQLGMNTPSRPRGLAAMRSITAPPQLSFGFTPPSKMRPSVGVDGTVEASENIVSESSTEEPQRLRTFQSIPTDMPPSPPDSSAGHDLTESPAQTRDFAMREEQSEPQRSATVERAGVDALTTNNVQAWPTLPGEQFSGSEPISRSLESLPVPARHENTKRAASPHAIVEQIATEERTKTPPIASNPDDPFAAIQARILARRSLSGTTSFHPVNTSPTSSSSSSTTVASRRSTSSQSRHQNAFASALVRKAYTAFLGPPAQLVAIMLRIAARIANGTFGTTFGSGFIIASPAGSKLVPGSFNLESIDADDLEQPDLEEWEEDDFGVPLRSPVRLAKLQGSRSGLRERNSRASEVD